MNNQEYEWARITNCAACGHPLYEHGSWGGCIHVDSGIGICMCVITPNDLLMEARRWACKLLGERNAARKTASEWAGCAANAIANDRVADALAAEYRLRDNEWRSWYKELKEKYHVSIDDELEGGIDRLLADARKAAGAWYAKVVETTRKCAEMEAERDAARKDRDGYLDSHNTWTDWYNELKRKYNVPDAMPLEYWIKQQLTNLDKTYTKPCQDIDKTEKENSRLAHELADANSRISMLESESAALDEQIDRIVKNRDSQSDIACRIARQRDEAEISLNICRCFSEKRREMLNSALDQRDKAEAEREQLRTANSQLLAENTRLAEELQRLAEATAVVTSGRTEPEGRWRAVNGMTCDGKPVYYWTDECQEFDKGEQDGQERS